ncbi:MAG TPA: GntR family transcriptional regulator [Thermoanaerobaculia bacterium]
MSALLEKSSPVPLYHQLEQVLADRIAQGLYRAGLPGEPELVMEFGISRGTVRQALDRLTRRGLIVRHQGRGSFVAPLPLEYPLGRFYRFAHEMSERGITQSSRVLAAAPARTPARVARRLRVPAGSRSVRVVRLRLAGDRPLLLETSHIAETVAGPLLDEDLSRASIYDVLDAAGVHLTRVTEDVRAVTLARGEAEPFLLAPGTPAFAVERLAWAGETPAEHRLVLAPADRVTLTASWGNDPERI